MSDSNGRNPNGATYTNGQPFLELNHESLTKMSPRDLVKPLREKPDGLALRFASGSGGHYIRFNPERGRFFAVHSGPHGPENRPAQVDMRNISLLQSECERIETVTIDESPFVTPEIRGV